MYSKWGLSLLTPNTNFLRYGRVRNTGGEVRIEKERDVSQIMRV